LNTLQPSKNAPQNVALSRSYCVEITTRLAHNTSHWVALAQQAGVQGVQRCQGMALYFLQGTLTDADVQQIAQQLLADDVVESYHYQLVNTAAYPATPNQHSIEVTLLAGVTDTVADSLLRSAHSLGITTLERAASGQRYLIEGDLSADDLERLARDVLSNTVIQRYSIGAPIEPPFVATQLADNFVATILVRGKTDAELVDISKTYRLSLDLAEMRAIQAYFAQEGRDPSDAELEMLAQTWSEHCVHKTFRAKIDYHGPEGQREINGLLKTYIRAATEQINKDWVRSAFVDNAGIVAFDDRFDLAFKVETHNHPSALEPFGGANTGVGGVIRDVLGVSARPIANTDILCFGNTDLPHEQLPSGVLHPRRVEAGVIAGIEDYGNKMGIPTVNGAIFYHDGYTANPLVFCGCLGLLPRGSHPTGAQVGDLIVVVGGRTGRDGLRGATFSSMEMDTTTSEIASVSVQIGHPIHEKQVLEVVLRARDERLYTAITDCGAGGLSSAVGEMGKDLGAHVKLETVPLKYPGLRPWEIWLSEAQERMVLAVQPAAWPRLQAICAGQSIEAVAIGTFDDSGRLRLTYEQAIVGDLSMHFLHDGIPQRQLRGVFSLPAAMPTQRAQGEHYGETLLRLLAHPNIRSKETVIRRYDHEVQGGGVVKPLVGVANHAPSDASVLMPHDVQRQGDGRAVALSNGMNPLYGALDPYAMAWAAVDEALRNIIAVGADPQTVAILDNFCWGNPTLEDRLGALVRCVQGCYDAAIAYQTPFISGKDSLNNEYTDADGRKHAIPGTLLISALGLVPNVEHAVTMDLKHADNRLYMLGETRDELGGSHYHLIHGFDGGLVPQPVFTSPQVMAQLHRAITRGLVRACHDVSEGGIALALAEMCIGGRLGAQVDLSGDAVVALFSETQGRFIVEIAGEHANAFEALFADLMCTHIGFVTSAPQLRITIAQETVIAQEITVLENAWRGHVVADDRAHEHAFDDKISHSQEAQNQQKATAREALLKGKPRVLVLHATGTNRDRDAALACDMAGGAAEIVHINQLIGGERRLLDYHMLVVPGGFSYGDDLGAGRLWALDLAHRLGQEMESFIQQGRPVLGICNGFQALVKAGYLPDVTNSRSHKKQTDGRKTTLTRNQSGRFECRWVYLSVNSHSQNLFTEKVTELIYCPVAHGEGQIASAEAFNTTEGQKGLWDQHTALVYTDADGNHAPYPFNPNGSLMSIAGLSNSAGNVLGLMPHPENHIFPWQHPRWARGERGMSGLRLFENGVRHA
jgi:phosphoribosylformylglycinamidine synthase II/phosphoribosylformylglycinamidine synthase I